MSNCIGSLSEKPSEILVKIIDTICEDRTRRMIKSTEEALVEITKFNQAQLNGENDPEDTAKGVIGTSDVSGLFVEVDPEEAGKQIRDAVMESEWVMNVNASEMVKFVALNLPRREVAKHGLLDCIPERKSFKRQGPTMKGQEMNRRPGKRVTPKNTIEEEEAPEKDK